ALGADRGAPEAGEGEAASAPRSRRAGHGAVLIRLPDLEDGLGDGATAAVVHDTVQAPGPGRARGPECAGPVIAQGTPVEPADGLPGRRRQVRGRGEISHRRLLPSSSGWLR